MGPRRQLHRIATSLLVAASLLFSQVALANYLCPVAEAPDRAAALMAEGEPCSGMDPVTPVLCHQFAADAYESIEAVKVTAPTLPVIVQVLILPLTPDSAEAMKLPFSTAPDIRPPPEPVFLQTLRLRV